MNKYVVYGKALGIDSSLFDVTRQNRKIYCGFRRDTTFETPTFQIFVLNQANLGKGNNTLISRCTHVSMGIEL